MKLEDKSKCIDKAIQRNPKTYWEFLEFIDQEFKKWAWELYYDNKYKKEE